MTQMNTDGPGRQKKNLLGENYCAEKLQFSLGGVYIGAVKSNPAVTSIVIALLAGCAKVEDRPGGKPEHSAKEFLRLVHKQDCTKAWEFFSAASQEKIRQESARAIKDAPYYADVFSPENLYCKSTYANRFLAYEANSPTLKSSDGTNAVVVAMLKEGTDFLIPGFFPTRYKRTPVEMNLLMENGAWKIDLVRPTAPERELEAARQKVLEKERQAVAELLRQRAEAAARATNSSALQTNAP